MNWENIKLLKNAWKEHLLKVKWQLFITLRFQGDMLSFESAESKCKELCRDIGKGFGIRVSSIGVVVNENNFTHCHLLLYGMNKNGKTLLDCEYKNIKQYWKYDIKIDKNGNTLLDCEYNNIKQYWKYDIKIDEIYNMEGVLGYIVDHNMIEGRYDVFHYGTQHIQGFFE